MADFTENVFHLVITDCVGRITVYKIHSMHRGEFYAAENDPNKIDLLLHYTPNIIKEVVNLKKDVYVNGLVMFVSG